MQRNIDECTYFGLETEIGRKTGDSSLRRSSDTSRYDGLLLLCFMQEFKIIRKLPMQFITKQVPLLNIRPQK